MIPPTPDRATRLRAMAEELIRDHNDFCIGHFVADEPWCSAAPMGSPLCANCSAFADSIATKMQELATAIEGEVREQCAQQESYLLEALKAARDLLVSCQKQAGYIPGQGYSTTLTAHEMTLARGIEDIDAIIAAAIRAGRQEG